MCKEDIRLARAAVPGRATVTTPTATGLRALAGNAERYSLSAHLANGVTAANSYAVSVYAAIGGLEYPLIGLSGEHPAGHVSLPEVGSVITGDIYIRAVDSTAVVDVTVAEVKWNQTQETI